MRILLAEDERTISRLITQVLARLGHNVTGVDSATEAIRLLESESFDLVLLDLHLTDGDGMRVVEAVNRERLPNIPVILMTGEHVYADEDPRVGMVSGILPKPFEIEDLEQAISRFSA